MARKKRTDSSATGNVGDAVASLKYPAKRKNIPPAGSEAQGVIREAPTLRYQYNPVLRSAPDAAEVDKLPDLSAIARQRPLSADEAQLLAGALRKQSQVGGLAEVNRKNRIKVGWQGATT